MAYQVANTTSEEHTSTRVAENPNKQREQCTIQIPKRDNIELWHHRFCHINTHILKQTEQAVCGMVIQDKQNTNFFCEGCVLGKQQRSTYPENPEKERDTPLGTFFHIDLCGPMSVTSLGGASYFMLCKDNNIGYLVIYFLKQKSEALAYMKQLYSSMKQELQVDILRIKTDQGGEFKSHQFHEYTEDKGIIHDFSAAYASEQNGFIERSNRTIVEATKSMLHSRNLPLNLWAEATNTTMFVWNRTVSKQLSDVTPFEKMFHQVPDVSYFKVFGSDAYLHVPKKQRTKLAAKSQKLVLVGYDQKGRAYRLWNSTTKRIYVGVDVIIRETLGIATTIPHYSESPVEDGTIFLHPATVSAAPNIPANTHATTDVPSVNMPDVSNNSVPNLHDHLPPDQFQNEDAYYEANSIPVQTLDSQPQPLQRDTSTLSQGDTLALQEQEENDTDQQGETILPPSNESSHIHPTATGSTSFQNTSEEDNRGNVDTDLDAQNTESILKPRSRHPPVRYGEWVKYDNNKSKDGSAAYIANQSARILEPKTYQEAMQSSHVLQWKEAMAKEFTSSIANKTWALKPLPEGRKAVKCKWIYKVKYKPSGEVERFKARLVAKGYSQVAGVDFT